MNEKLEFRYQLLVLKEKLEAKEWDESKHPRVPAGTDKGGEFAKLESRKLELLKRVDELAAIKKKLYSNMDIESPMSDDEKLLNKNIADLFSEINTIVLKKRKLKTGK
jgi:hypothetical protein